MAIPSFTTTVLDQIADVLEGEVEHRELTHVFAITEEPGLSKKKRLFNHFIALQARDRVGSNVGALIQAVLAPVRYKEHLKHEQARERINRVLTFAGLFVNEKGLLIEARVATTVTEAQRQAAELRKKLVDRQIHGQVLQFATGELFARNDFHAVLEATKSLADRVRSLAGLIEDGSDLFQKAFASKAPILAINSLQTQSEASEHRGFVNFCVGIFGMYRNVTAHEAKIRWPMDGQDALDALTAISIAHRKLDKAIRVPAGVTVP